MLLGAVEEKVYCRHVGESRVDMTLTHVRIVWRGKGPRSQEGKGQTKRSGNQNGWTIYRGAAQPPGLEKLSIGDGECQPGGSWNR